MKTFVFDLDGTLCTWEKGGNYEDAIFFRDRITKVNQLYEQGHTIMIDSARGTLHKKDWQKITEKQLKTWGVKYHYLRTGVKWQADVYIDDRAIKDIDFFK
jgi:hypothetical protein